MPRPDVLLLEGDEFGHAMLYRYTAGGEFGGDTWRERVEDGQACRRLRVWGGGRRPLEGDARERVGRARIRYP